MTLIILEIKTYRDIKKGEELTISYIPIYGNTKIRKEIILQER
jgi:SET domain-containing protein